MKKILKVHEKIYYDRDLTGASSTRYIYRKYYIEKNKDINDYFISFTKLDKLGVNPQSKYNTPLGIYTYPLKEFFERYVNSAVGRLDKPMNNQIETEKIGKFAPFAGDSPFVWVVKANRSKGKIIDVLDYSKKDYDKDINYLLKNEKENILNIEHNDRGYVIDRLNQYFGTYSETNTYNDILDYIRNTHRKEIQEELLLKILEIYANDSLFSPLGGKMWNITRMISDRNPVKWNSLWRRMGYMGITDRSGSEIIHRNEPIQAVFFSKSSFDIIEKVQNIRASGAKLSNSEITTLIYNFMIECSAKADKLMMNKKDIKKNDFIDLLDYISKEIKSMKYVMDVNDLEKVLTSGIRMTVSSVYKNKEKLSFPIRDLINFIDQRLKQDGVSKFMSLGVPLVDGGYDVLDKLEDLEQQSLSSANNDVDFDNMIDDDFDEDSLYED